MGKLRVSADRKTSHLLVSFLFLSLPPVPPYEILKSSEVHRIFGWYRNYNNTETL